MQACKKCKCLYHINVGDNVEEMHKMDRILKRAFVKFLGALF